MSRIKRYEIHHADAFTWLEARAKDSIQAVVTDPPFGLVEFSSEELTKRDNGKGIWRLPQNFDGHQRMPMPRFTILTLSHHKAIQAFHARLAKELLRVMVPGAHAIIASQNLLLHYVMTAFFGQGFEIRGQIVRVVKTLRGGDRPKGAHDQYSGVSVTPRSCWEPWLIFRKPCDGLVRENLEKWGTGALRRPSEHSPFTDLIPSSPARPNERKIAPHPALKPQAFVRQVVWAVLPLGSGIVLDPFMGSGSTIAAAEHHKYRSIGLETNEGYFRMSQGAIPELAVFQTNTNGSTSTNRKHNANGKTSAGLYVPRPQYDLD